MGDISELGRSSCFGAELYISPEVQVGEKHSMEDTNMLPLCALGFSVKVQEKMLGELFWNIKLQSASQ